jgi:hypothetical protein
MPAQAAAYTDARERFLVYLAQQRDGLRYAAHGLTEAQARRTPSASALSSTFALLSGVGEERNGTGLMPAPASYAAGARAYRMVSCKAGESLANPSRSSGLCQSHDCQMARRTQVIISENVPRCFALPYDRTARSRRLWKLPIEEDHQRVICISLVGYLQYTPCIPMGSRGLST